MFKKMSDVVSTRAQKCTTLVCEFNLRVIGAQRGKELLLVPENINKVLDLLPLTVDHVCAPASPSSCPSE